MTFRKQNAWGKSGREDNQDNFREGVLSIFQSCGCITVARFRDCCASFAKTEKLRKTHQLADLWERGNEAGAGILQTKIVVFNVT